MNNALTIDVEDYFHVSAFEKYIRPEDWESYPFRAGDGVLKILDTLDEFRVSATFFVLGWVAERFPGLVVEIKKRGHEVACHGYWHKLVYSTGRDVFRQDVRRAKSVLEDITGAEVKGYRAPSYSITAKSLWALDILVEEGFAYDSSIFPIVHDIYGIPGASRFPHEINTSSGAIMEFPMSTIDVPGVGFKLPFAGGGYLRVLPVWAVKRAISYMNTRELQPAVLYFHPWEIDPGQPRIKASLRSRFRHYVNLNKTMTKIRFLLSLLKFAPMADVLDL